jgi:two-component system, chemotaxis family, CheB/CheR fusion protein
VSTIDRSEESTRPEDAPGLVALEKPPLPFPVVGIGASAGGIKALQAFFDAMPPDTGMAFVVVVHLSPRHESSLAEVLQPHTSMRVTQVMRTVAIEADHVYVIPPNRRLMMTGGHLRIEEFPGHDGRAAIDVFFRSLAMAHRQNAIAIVLSGSGSDGAVGLKRIKEHGGVTLVQVPSEAEYDSMPRAAQAAGIVDFSLPVAEMPDKLVALWRNLRSIALPMPEAPSVPRDEAQRMEEALSGVLALLKARTGHDFNDYKRATIVRRLERRLQVNQLPDLPRYRDFLERHPSETRALLKDLLISVTNFFRDKEVFDKLGQDILPNLLADKALQDHVRAWVPACATGEEAYSIAMLVTECAERLGAAPAVQIFATDIDEEALQAARVGFYPESIALDVSETRLRRFFVRESGGYRVHSAIREMVMFAPHNVLRDPPFSRIDLVTCRNLLIYLNREVQTRVLDIFHFALRPRGYLVLGSSESVDDRSESFAPVDKVHRIFQAQPVGHPFAIVPRSTVLMPLARPGAPPAPPTLRQAGGMDLHLRLLEHYAPPSVVVNDQHEVLHLSESAGQFLKLTAGEPSFDLLRMAPPELRAPLRATLYQAFHTMEQVELRAPMHRDDQPVELAVRVHPVREGASGRVYALVMFDERTANAPDAAHEELAPVQVSLLERLEQELGAARTQLRTTIEQYETQTEELRASNEELQAVNEELRSTTEELETSKEELQSMNEELGAVNQELKNKVEETAAINNDLQNFMASTDIAVLFVDRDKRVLRFTPPARDLFNLIPADLGRPLLDLHHRLEYPEMAGDLDAVFETLTLREREIVGTGERWYLARILPYRTSEDRIDGAVLTFIDISSRRLAEDELRRNAEWMRFVMDSARDYAIFTTDANGVVESWSGGAARTFGWSRDEATGRPMHFIFTPEDRESGRPEEEMRKAREDGRAEDERWHLRKDGTRFYCSGIMAPIRNGKLRGYVKIARDLTSRQQAEMEREQALARERDIRLQLERANRQKDDFLATLSHELRNPLNLIMMQAQVLLRADAFKDEKSRHTAEIIYQTTATQARLVDDLLDVSRTLTGKLALQRQLLPLPFIVGDSIGALVREAEQKGVTLDLDLTAEPLLVQGDPARLRQIAWNLLSNAIKFTPAGGKVSIGLVREGDQARLDVTDTGRGIDPAHLPHVFELYRQNPPVLTRSSGGLGIGLALVHQLVEAHSGRIEAHSEGVDRGTRFSVWLPLYDAASPEVQEPPTVAAHDGQSVPSLKPLMGLGVLLVDDAEDAVGPMTELLEMEGAHVRGTTRPEEALVLAAQHDFDVIVSDLAMPGMDGLTLLRRIRSTTRNRNTPAIATTGFNRPQDVARATAAGFDAYVSKPLSIPELIGVIVEVIKPKA